MLLVNLSPCLTANLLVCLSDSQTVRIFSNFWWDSMPVKPANLPYCLPPSLCLPACLPVFPLTFSGCVGDSVKPSLLRPRPFLIRLHYDPHLFNTPSEPYGDAATALALFARRRRRCRRRRRRRRREYWPLANAYISIRGSKAKEGSGANDGS